MQRDYDNVTNPLLQPAAADATAADAETVVVAIDDTTAIANAAAVFDATAAVTASSKPALQSRRVMASVDTSFLAINIDDKSSSHEPPSALESDDKPPSPPLPLLSQRKNPSPLSDLTEQPKKDPLLHEPSTAASSGMESGSVGDESKKDSMSDDGKEADKQSWVSIAFAGGSAVLASVSNVLALKQTTVAAFATGQGGIFCALGAAVGHFFQLSEIKKAVKENSKKLDDNSKKLDDALTILTNLKEKRE